MANSTPPESFIPAPDAPAAPALAAVAAPPPRVSWLVWVWRDAASTILLFFLYFFLFSLLSHDLIPRDRLWTGAGNMVLGCQLFLLTCVLLQKRLPWLWAVTKTSVVVLFVVWHLFFFLVRNPLDLWSKPLEDWCKKQGWWKGAEPYYDKTDRITKKYGNFFGIEQGWKMFPPPLARYGWFLDSEITFTDDSVELFPSDNEPDLAHYVRLGGWRQRKLETFMEFATPEELHHSRLDEAPIFEAYVRWRLRRWREEHPGDSRTPEKVKLVRRRFELPRPGDDPTKYPAPDVTEVGTFGHDGRLR